MGTTHIHTAGCLSIANFTAGPGAARYAVSIIICARPYYSHITNKDC